MKSGEEADGTTELQLVLESGQLKLVLESGRFCRLPLPGVLRVEKAGQIGFFAWTETSKWLQKNITKNFFGAPRDANFVQSQNGNFGLCVAISSDGNSNEIQF